MNLAEAIDLLDAVSGFNFKASEEKPEFSIVDDQKEGFRLFAKTELFNENYRDHIEKMVESRKLKIRESGIFNNLQSSLVPIFLAGDD